MLTDSEANQNHNKPLMKWRVVLIKPTNVIACQILFQLKSWIVQLQNVEPTPFSIFDQHHFEQKPPCGIGRGQEQNKR